MTSRRNSTIAVWLVAALVAPLVYVASFDPMCWFVSWTGRGCHFASVVYHPILRAGLDGPPVVVQAIHAYANLGVNRRAGHEAGAAITLFGEYELSVCDPESIVLIGPNYRRPDWSARRR